MINKINFTLPQYKYNWHTKDSSQQNTFQNNTSLSNVYYTPINFQGTGRPSLRVKLRFTEPLHCPTCGVEMMSEEKLEEIKQTKCDTAQDLANLIAKNKQYVPKNMQSVVEKINDFTVKRPEMPANITLGLIHKNLNFLEQQEITKLKISVKKFTYDNNFSSEDKEKAKEITKNLNAHLNNEINYNETKENIGKIILSLETPAKNELYHLINESLKKMMLDRFCFSAKGVQNLTPEERIEIFLNKLFLNSVKDFKMLKSDNARYNEEPVATCKGCTQSKSTIVDWTLPPEKSAENLARYFEDLYNSTYFDSQLKDHVIKVKYAAEAITKNNVNFSKITSPEFEKIKNDIFNSEAIYAKFDLANEEGIPCAGCSTITIPYEQKENIREEIANAKDIHELQNIIHKYPQHIKDLFKPVYECFDIILEHFPNISEDLMYTSLVDIYNRKLTNAFKEIENFAKTKIEDPKTSLYDQCIYKEYLASVGDKYSNIEKVITVDEYFDIYNPTLATINNSKDRSKLLDIKETIWTNSMLQSLLNPPAEYARDTESRLRDVINYTFARASASVDHMVARSKGGPDSPENLMILCNDCNKHKKDKAFIFWVNKENNALQNLQNYVNKINEIIRERKLEKYYSYPQSFVTHVRELTKGKISLNTPTIDE